ncbi:sodium-dependent transporter [Thermococcus sp.]|uniref:sodium-dependent transporter n=1 Tax=Thermococcus sp. TaxID=35749 RepID=UPI0026389286|nr:sodium-dependent transporter [Thermococcus sp.]
MDEMKKWTLYITFLVAGFATGIGSIGLFPQFWLEYGMTGLIVHVIFLALFAYLAILETETVMKSGYYFVELFQKVLKKPAIVLTFFIVIVMFLSYYTANVMLSLLSPVLGTGTVGRLIAKLLMFAIVFVIITRAKEKTFVIMAGGSLLFVIAVIVTTIAFKVVIPENPAYLNTAKSMVFSWPGITFNMIKDAAVRAIYGVGLGFAFYLMLGSFLNERFNAKLIIGSGIFIEFLISIFSTFIVVYSVSLATVQRLAEYAYGGEEGAIKFMGDLPTILSHHPLLLALIATSIFFAGLTSILPTAEVGLQIVESTMKVSRGKAATYLTAIALGLGILDSPPSIADMMLKAVTISTFFTAIYEAYPIIAGKASGVEKGVAVFASLIFAIAGLGAFYLYGKMGGVYILSAILAAIVVLFGLFGDSLVKKGTEEGT